MIQRWGSGSADQPQIVVHERSDGEDVRGIHPGAHNLQPETDPQSLAEPHLFSLTQVSIADRIPDPVRFVGFENCRKDRTMTVKSCFNK